MSDANKDLAVAELMARDYLEHAVAPFGQAEHWATREGLVTMLQPGVVQPPGQPPS